jgi:hypothetical protein
VGLLSLRRFVNQLIGTGRVHVAARGLPADQDADAPDAMREVDVVARLDAPGDPPVLDVPAAVWAAGVLNAACRLLVYRDLTLGPDTPLAPPCPSGPSASAVWSADLTLRYLPDVLRHARAVAQDDPLVAALLELARAWPLSSVGVPGVPRPLDLTHVWSHPSLRQLYVDRVIERQDNERLNDPATAGAVVAAVGAHGELLRGLRLPPPAAGEGGVVS